MTLPIVDFDTAKDLKELGFDWVCTSDFKVEQALVTKWLRDVHKLSIEPELLRSEYKCCVATTTDGYFDIVIGGSKFNAWPTYEESELEGIQKTIQYLKDV